MMFDDFPERWHHSGDCLDCLQHEAGRSQRKHNVLRHWMTGPQGHGQHGNMQLSYKIRYLSWNPDWWFGTWFFFPYIGNNNPNWLQYYFSEGWLDHQPVYISIYIMGKWLVPMSAGLCRKCWINVYAITIHREYHAEYPSYDRFLRSKSWSSDVRIHLGLRDGFSTT